MVVELVAVCVVNSDVEKTKLKGRTIVAIDEICPDPPTEATRESNPIKGTWLKPNCRQVMHMRQCQNKDATHQLTNLYDCVD